MDRVVAEQGWAKITARTKEMMGEVYEDPRTQNEDGFVTNDLNILFGAMDYDQWTRAELWRRNKQQGIAIHDPLKEAPQVPQSNDEVFFY